VAPRPSLRLIGFAVAAGMIATLAGCERLPTDEALRNDLAGYVEGGYIPGLFEVIGAERLSNRLVPELALPGVVREGRTIAYTANLKLKRDYDFGGWEQANAATLALLLGARADALRGLKPGGNKSGDVIRVDGAVIYKHTDAGQWRLAAAMPSPAATDQRRARLEILGDWANFTANSARAMWDPSSAGVESLDEAAKMAAARTLRADGGVALASGPRSSDYWNVAEAMGSIQSSEESGSPPLLNVATQGTRENLRLLRDGVVTGIVLRSNEAALAAAGQEPFDADGTFPGLRAVASLFPEQIHIVVAGASTLAAVTELDGKRVIVAASGPAAKNEAYDILRAHRVGAATLDAMEVMPLVAALAALQRQDCDAVVVTAPAPSPAIRDFAAANPVRLLPVEADALALLTTGTTNYLAVTVPALAYPGQDRPIATVGVVAMLASVASVAPGETELLLRRAFAGIDFMSHKSPFSAMVRKTTAQRGLTLPLHPGAEAYFSPPVTTAPK
jgi:TRAP transporter TAXI family solute receptor